MLPLPAVYRHPVDAASSGKVQLPKYARVMNDFMTSDLGPISGAERGECEWYEDAQRQHQQKAQNGACSKCQ